MAEKLSHWGRKLRIEFVTKYLTTRDVEVRRKAAKEHFPARFHDVTLVGDGKGCSIWFQQKIASSFYKDELCYIEGQSQLAGSMH
jgi:hypothetical protein